MNESLEKQQNREDEFKDIWHKVPTPFLLPALGGTAKQTRPPRRLPSWSVKRADFPTTRCGPTGHSGLLPSPP